VIPGINPKIHIMKIPAAALVETNPKIFLCLDTSNFWSYPASWMHQIVEFFFVPYDYNYYHVLLISIDLISNFQIEETNRWLQKAPNGLHAALRPGLYRAVWAKLAGHDATETEIFWWQKQESVQGQGQERGYPEQRACGKFLLLLLLRCLKLCLFIVSRSNQVVCLVLPLFRKFKKCPESVAGHCVYTL